MKRIGVKITVLILVSLFCNFSFSQKIIAHRGASFNAPENTISAVKLGFEEGAHAVEVDVRLTQDKKLILMHDYSTKRTAKKDFDVQHTHSDSLQGLDVGSWKAERFKGEKIPFLEDILSIVPKNKKLVIEIKGNQDLSDILNEAIAGVSRDQITFISFNLDLVKALKEKFSDIPVLWLLHNWDEYTVDEAIEVCLSNDLDGLNLNAALIDSKNANKILDNNLKLYAYTVNEIKEAKRLQSLKIQAITTDKPGLLIKNLK